MAGLYPTPAIPRAPSDRSTNAQHAGLPDIAERAIDLDAWVGPVGHTAPQPVGASVEVIPDRLGRRPRINFVGEQPEAYSLHLSRAVEPLVKAVKP